MNKGVELDITPNTTSIKTNELAYKIGLCLVEGDLTAEQLTDRIYKNHNPNGITIDFLSISVSYSISGLLNSQLVLKEVVDGKIYYKASNYFRKIVGES